MSLTLFMVKTGKINRVQCDECGVYLHPENARYVMDAGDKVPNCPKCVAKRRKKTIRRGG